MSNQRHTIRHLARTAIFSATRGFGAAMGSAVVAGLVWWLQHR